MKRVDLIRTIEGFGWVLVRHGGKHDWYRNPGTGISQPVPRHREIKEGLAQHIIKMLSNPAAGRSGSESTENSSA
jgi:predicted RNA binding protein YcfA (HicA-like mRNA interferase family)